MIGQKGDKGDSRFDRKRLTAFTQLAADIIISGSYRHSRRRHSRRHHSRRHHSRRRHSDTLPFGANLLCEEFAPHIELMARQRQVSDAKLSMALITPGRCICFVILDLA